MATDTHALFKCLYFQRGGWISLYFRENVYGTKNIRKASQPSGFYFRAYFIEISFIYSNRYYVNLLLHYLQTCLRDDNIKTHIFINIIIPTI